MYKNWWEPQLETTIYDIAIRLNRQNAILFYLRYFIDRKDLKSVYYAIFEPIYVIPHLFGHQI